jgi:hypothetical protein
MATKKSSAASPVEVTEYGFRLPAPIPASGDTTFDAALAQLVKKCEGAFKKGQCDVTLPARLSKLRPGDDDRIRAQLAPDIDVGTCEFDMARGGDKNYLAAWRTARAECMPRELYLAALAKLALATEPGEHAVRALLATALPRHTFAARLVEAIVASTRTLSDETLALAARALETDGKPQELYLCWIAAARAALALGPARAATLLAPHLATTRAKAVADALSKTALDPVWRDPVLALATEGHEHAVQLLVQLPPDAEILAALANDLQRQATQYGSMLSKWAFDHLVAHADDVALAAFPSGVAAAVTAARSTV